MYVCVCVQAVQQDPRVTQLVKDLSQSIQTAAEDSGDNIPAVLVLNKVSHIVYLLSRVWGSNDTCRIIMSYVLSCMQMCAMFRLYQS